MLKVQSTPTSNGALGFPARGSPILNTAIGRFTGDDPLLQDRPKGGSYGHVTGRVR